MSEIGNWPRVQKDQKNQQELEQPQYRRCYDWIVVSGDCHYAKNHASFKTYRPIIGGTAQGAQVAGIGTVELEVKRSPEGQETNMLVLEDVLHIPTAKCNGFRSRALQGTESWGAGVVQGFDGTSTQPTWYATEFCGLRRLVLAGNPQGESELEEGGHYSLSLYLSREERTYLFSEAESATDD